MTDRSTEPSGTARPEGAPAIDETAARPAVSEEIDIEKTKVAGIPRVTDDTATQQVTQATPGAAPTGPPPNQPPPPAQQSGRPGKRAAVPSQATSQGTSQQPEKPTLASTARSKLDAAKQAVAAGAKTAGAKATTATSTGNPGSGNPSPIPAPRGPRRARVRLTRIDPWTVMKNAFLLSIAFAVVTVVAVGMVWQVLGAAGVWDAVNDTIQQGIGGEDVSSFQVEDYVGTSRVLGFTMLVAAIDVVLLTAAATLTAFLYNMAASLLGGVEVTLSEDVD